jgi:hypothetical protein
MPETEGGTTIIRFGRCQLFTNRRELLPAQTSPLLDRQAELAEVLRLVAAHRLVTLTARFEEGFASPDLMAAKALLDELQ